MCLSPRRARMLAALTLTLLTVGAAVPCLQRPVPAVAASQGVSHAAQAWPAAVVADAITATAPLPQSAPSGLTTVQAPPQVRSGKALVVVAHTTPRALVTLTITFADGSMIQKTGRANLDGVARFAPVITYQPQSSAEAATVAVTAVLPRTGLNDTVPPFSVTVLPHIVLTGRVTASSSAVLGRYLTVTVAASPPNVAAHLTLTYPDNQVYRRTVYTDPATGIWTGSLRVSTLHGTGDMQVSAILSYGGVQRYLTPVTVRLRAPR